MAERQFGPYRLVRQVAVGGMAEIHLAKTKGIAGFEKYVALKMIHPNFAEDEQFIQMLIDEAKIAVQLQHVNIAQTFDLGRVGDHYYITMEYVDGCDLYKILRRGSEKDFDVPIDVAAFVGKEIATGLDYAHRKKDMAGQPLSIVHRDVSPQNVLVSHAGEVKLVDFGIAKATSKARQTAAGVIKGKYYYMSPEQAWGDKLDHRSDIFSAGIVIYEMLVGQMLYLEEDLHRLLDMVRRAEIDPPSTLRRDVPPQLEQIVMKALAKAPADRYQSGQELANDLERFMHVHSPVFTAQRLARHLRAVMGDPVAISQAPTAQPDDPVISTLEIGDDELLLHDRSELSDDQNSVIFRLDALKPGADRNDPAANAAARPAARAPSVPPPPQPRAPGRPSTPPVGVPATRPAEARPGSIPPPGRAPGRPSTPPVGVPRTPVPEGSQSGPTLPERPPVPIPSQRAPSRPPLGRPRDPGEETKPVDPRMLAAATWNMDEEDLDGGGERTVISAPPQPELSAGFAQEGSTVDVPESTMIEQGWSEPTATEQARPAPRGDPRDDAVDEVTGVDDDDGPTLAPHEDDDGPTLSPHSRDMEDEDGPTLARSAAVRGAQASSSAITNKKPRAPGPAALAAHTPTPSVSELRRPARSRRTPAEGIVPPPSVLQAIVGAAGSEPMPQRPRDGVPQDPMRQGGSGPTRQPTAPPPIPSGTQPPPIQHPLAGPGQHVPQGGYPPGPQSPFAQLPPGQHQLPQHVHPGMQPGMQQGMQQPGMQQPGMQQPGMQQPGMQQPGMQQGYPQWPQHQQHGSQPPPFAQMQPQFGGYPQQGYPQMGPTFTQQMRAMMEVDEIPSMYKVQSGGPRWFVLAIAALVAVAAAAIATYFILRKDSEPRATASIIVNTVPEGATVFVDSQQLPDKTPAVFKDSAPGKRHVIVVSLPRHRPVEKTIEVPASGGEQRVSIALQKINGKILINTSPEGADIFIKGEPRGRTPANLVDIEIETTKDLELRHKDFGTRTIPLVWPDSGEVTLQVDLKK